MAEALESALKMVQSASKRETSLEQCFAMILELEEPIILKVYPPILQALRAHWSDRAMNFYVMVRAHASNLASLIGPFCGDPNLLQRSNGLIQKFEQELQRQQVIERAGPAPVRRSSRKAVRGKKSSISGARKTSKARPPKRQKVRVRSARPRVLSKSSKPLVRNLKLARRRARA